LPRLRHPVYVAAGADFHRSAGILTDDEIYLFIQQSIASVWALELLLLLRRTEPRAWAEPELVRELRSSDTIVRDALARFSTLGLVMECECRHQYRPASGELGGVVDEIARIYAAKPVSVVKAIMSAPNEKLRIFSDAFRLKD
jgi:hypothetical protein